MRKIDFLRLKKKLLNQAKMYNVKVSFRKRKFKRNNFGVNGSYSCLKKGITITTAGKPSYSLILAVLAHEIRHSEQDFYKIYPNQYLPEVEKLDSTRLKEKILSKEITIASLEEAQIMENDCNQFAINFMNENGFPLNKEKRTYSDFFKPYPIYQTVPYRLKALVDSRNYYTISF